ncbi:phospholipid carrier-dependent glycosyltransferase [Paenibacillus sp. D51F]
MKPTYIRPILLLLAAAVILLGGRMTAYAADELLANPGFEAGADNMPQGWSKDGYKLDDSVTSWSLQQGAGGEPARYLRVQNLQPNDARWLQRVTVKPDTLYRISASVRAAGAEAGKTGANLSVLGPVDTSVSLYDTAGAWQPLEVYGRTGPSQDTMDVLLRLGGYGSENVGTADFSAVSVTEAAEAPAGAAVISLDPSSAPAPAPAEPAAAAHKAPGYLIPLAFLGGAAFLYAFSIAYRALFSRNEATASINWLRKEGRDIAGSRALWLLLGGGLLLRLLLAPTMQGHPIDFPDFSIWADRAYSVGLNGFFSDDVFADYPPGYIYVLYVVGMLKHLFGLSGASGGVILLVKLPAILADLAAGRLLYGIARERFGKRVSLMAAGLYIFNPAVWFDSALWAQADSVMTLLVLLAVRALFRSRHAAGAAWLAAAVLVKPQAVIFLPLLLFALMSSRSGKEWLKAAGAGIAAALLLLLPFAVGREPLWIVEHYKAMFASYPYATLNAFNIYGLLGLNGIDAAKHWLGLPLSVWGNVGAALALAVMGLITFKKGRSGLYLAAFAGSLLVFLLKTGMHERYLYPALAFGLAAFLVSGSRRLLLLYGTLTVAVLANIAYVLRDSLQENYYIANGNGVMVLVSLVQTAAGAYFLYLTVQVWQGKRLGSLVAASGSGSFVLPEPAHDGTGTSSAERKPQPYEDSTSLPWRKEWWPVLAIVAVYAVMMFWQLGDAKAPKTAWQPASDVTVQVQGGPQAVDHLLLYAGIGDGTVQVSVSPDGMTWNAPVEQKLDGGTVFQWKSVPLAGQTAQAVRITGTGTAVVYEAGLFGPDGTRLALAADGGSPLFDEQALVPDKPSYRNSMYFDEIYHSRTAYEHLHRIEPYETTHPPLGKVIISAGIALFGMNPFGWRVMGGIAGLLLIPAMYVFGRGLFRSRKGGLLAAALIFLDFMPLVQSRIGTVDTYAVLFIIMSYHFMNRFFQRNEPGTPLRRLLLPFALAGIFFGLGASVKWVGVYSGAGLAAIFFYSLVRRYLAASRTAAVPDREKKAKQTGGKGDDSVSSRASEKGFIAGMIGAGLLFFVLVPGVIYILTYIPFMRVPGPGHGLKNVIEFQKFMYDYHSKLVATHPFSSTWWEWPIISRPIWYYSGSGLVPGQIASIVSLGNPLLWWAGIPCAVAAFIAAWKRKERAMQVVTIGLLSQYLPWVGIPRLTFIYHYYATVPFMLLCIVYVLLQLPQRIGAKQAKAATWIYLGAAAVLMAMFYPVLTGQTISRDYAVHFLKWFGSWTFF